MEIDLERVRLAVVTALPLRSRWLVGEVPLDYDFRFAHCGLLSRDKNAFETKEWPGFWAFGVYDYADGGGATPWLGVCKTSGVVCGLDLDGDKEPFPLNSSIHQFIQTFDFLEHCLLKSDVLPPHAAARLQEIDPQVYPTSNWKLLVDHLLKVRCEDQ